MSKCWFCYRETSDGLEYHDGCAKRFFGTPKVPQLELNDELLEQLARETINERIAVTGVQPKLSVTLQKAQGGSRLTIVGLWGEYILKPQHHDYPFMPENEDLTMHLATLFKLPVCAHALLRASDGHLVYLAKRFDREKGRKWHMEDFCQLSGFLTEQKYHSSYEKIGKLIHQYCTHSGADVLAFFELVLFSFLCGNNDMHLKNFAVLHLPSGIHFSPAYDLLNVTLVNPADAEELALTLNGKKRRFRFRDLEQFGLGLQIAPEALRSSFRKFLEKDEAVEALIRASYLDEEAQERYLKIWRQRQDVLRAGMVSG